MVTPLNSVAAKDVAYHLHSYQNARRHEKEGPLVVARGEGVRVFDEDGHAYIEAVASLWYAALGFSETRLVDAATRQMQRLPCYHSFGNKVADVSASLAERLIQMAPTPMRKAYFACSGSEANDTAVKIVRYYNNALGRDKKKKIIARQKGYHGTTLATASLTGIPRNHWSFDLPLPGILHTDCPHYYRYACPGESEETFSERLAQNLEAMILEEGPETIAAFFAEPVMGSGGIIVPPARYFEKVQQVLNKYDILFVADEVICGFGRLEHMFGSQAFDLKPDLIVVAKALSAGYQPISAVMINDSVYDVLADETSRLGVFGHGFTYSAHPVPAAVALEALRIYEEDDILTHVRHVGPKLQAGLRRLSDHRLVGEVRGLGLIAGIELVRDKMTKESFDASVGAGLALEKACLERGLIVRAIGDVVAIAPPLIISAKDVEEITDRLEHSLEDVARRCQVNRLAGSGSV